MARDRAPLVLVLVSCVGLSCGARTPLDRAAGAEEPVASPAGEGGADGAPGPSFPAGGQSGKSASGGQGAAPSSGAGGAGPTGGSAASSGAGQAGKGMEKPVCVGVPSASDPSAWPGEVEVLVSGLKFARDIAIDDEYVYFTNVVASGAGHGEVRRVSKSGGATDVLAEGLVNPTDLVVDGEGVYVVDASALHVLKVPKVPGGQTVVLAPILTFRLTQDDTFLYLGDLGTDRIYRVPKSGGPPVTLAEAAEKPQQLSVAGAWVYWAAYGDDTIRRVPKDGGATEIVSESGGHRRGVVADCTGVYWLSSEGLKWLPIEATTPSILAPPTANEGHLTLDERHVYVGSEPPRRVLRSGGEYESFPDGAELQFGPDLRVDAHHVYWVDNQHGTVNRLKK